MEEAVSRELIDFNPVKNVRPFAENRVKHDIFTPDDIRTLFPSEQALESIWKTQGWAALFYTLLHSGMRVGEIQALFWYSIHWDEKIIEIPQAMKASGEFGKPKSGKERATILLDFDNRSEMHDRRGWDLLRDWSEKSCYNGINDLVFPGMSGQRPPNKRTILDAFRAGIGRAGIDTEGRNLVVHSLRHTFVTEAKRKGLEGAFLRYATGHASEKISDIYTHNSPVETIRTFLPDK